MKKKILAVIILALILSSTVTVLSGCGCSGPDTATADEAINNVENRNTEPATLSDTDEAIINSGLTVDKDGKVVDSNGKEVKTTSDGKIEVKTADGKTIKVDTTEIKSANKNNANNSSSSGIGSAANKTNNNNSSANKKPADNSSSSAASSKPNNGTQTNKKPASNSTEKKPESSNQNSSGKQESSKTEETKHTHSWVDITKQVKVIDQEAYTYEEPVYEKQGRTICNDCGEDVTDGEVRREHILWAAQNINGHSKGSYHDEWVKVQVGTRTVTVPEEYHYETKIIGRKCSSCGKTEYY